MFEVFRSRKMAAILALGFSSGLPLFLTSRTLQAWMTLAHVNLTTIGFFSLTSLPYSLKFLWSPAIDRFSFPFLGRRKGWIFATQVALGLAIGAMVLARPPQALYFVAINALAIAFFSAPQDITIDAYTTDVSEASEVGAASGAKVLGYRIAMIASGAGALVLSDVVSWQSVYFIFGLAMLASAVVCARAPEPILSERPPISLREAIRMPLVDFFDRAGTARAAYILTFIMLYRLGDSMINNMTTSFLLQSGFSPTDIGLVQGGVGVFATIVGVLAGGAAMARIGINRSLWVFGFFQAASNLAYLVLAYAGKNLLVMVVAIIIENLCYGLATAALVGFIMTLCNPRFSATQYALLSSLVAVGRDVVASPSGAVAEAVGWPIFFALSVLAAVPGMIMLPFFAPWRETVSPQKARASHASQ
jgi:MFS transporter, PAT family, beta-lactamase induction signal transducer AmpG